MLGKHIFRLRSMFCSHLIYFTIIVVELISFKVKTWVRWKRKSAKFWRLSYLSFWRIHAHSEGFFITLRIWLNFFPDVRRSLHVWLYDCKGIWTLEHFWLISCQPRLIWSWMFIVILAVFYDKTLSWFYVNLFNEPMANSLRLIKAMNVSLCLSFVTMLRVFFKLVHFFAQSTINLIFWLFCELAWLHLLVAKRRCNRCFALESRQWIHHCPWNKFN